MTKFASTLSTAGLYLLLTALSVYGVLAYFPYAADDAYIHFRIAENLLQHGQPYYHLGEKVMASSSTGWTLTLALLLLLGAGQLQVVAIFNALVSVGVVFVSAAIAKAIAGQEFLKADVLAAAVIGPALFVAAAGLMESPTALLLFVIGFWLYLKKRPQAFLFFTVAAFFRLELAAFYAVFFLHNGFARTVPIKRALGYSLLAVAPFAAYSLYFYSTLIPNTVKAKALVYDMSVYENLITFVQPYMLPYIGKWGILAWGGAFLLLAARAIPQARFGLKAGVVLPLVCGGLLFVLYLARHTLIFSWYLPLFMVPLLLGMLSWVLLSRSRVLLVMFALTILPQTTVFANNIQGLFDEQALIKSEVFVTGARVRQFLEVSRRLYAHMPDATLMTVEIGGVGYGFRGRIADGVGLVTPEALRHHPMAVPLERSHGGIGALPVAYVEEVRPDIIVCLSLFVEAFERSAIRREYHRITLPAYIPEDVARAGDFKLWDSDLFIYLSPAAYARWQQALVVEESQHQEQ